MDAKDQALHQPDDSTDIFIAQPTPKIPASEGKLKPSELHEQKVLNTWLNLRKAERKLWPINPRSDKASTIRAGHPDYSIWLPGGRVLLMEMKVPGGVFSQEQFHAIALLEELGHPVQIPSSAAVGIALVEKFL